MLQDTLTEPSTPSSQVVRKRVTSSVKKYRSFSDHRKDSTPQSTAIGDGWIRSADVRKPLLNYDEGSSSPNPTRLKAHAERQAARQEQALAITLARPDTTGEADFPAPPSKVSELYQRLDSDSVAVLIALQDLSNEQDNESVNEEIAMSANQLITLGAAVNQDRGCNALAIKHHIASILLNLSISSESRKQLLFLHGAIELVGT